MNRTFHMTVNEALNHDYFKDAKLLSGKNGFNKIIKWTHIIESEEYSEWINGGEMIFTTGIGLKNGHNQQVSFIESLIKHHVTAIVIELGQGFKTIDEEIILLTEKYHVPLIIFEKNIKFIDIIQEMHKSIVNKHYSNLNELNLLSKKFNKYALSPSGITKILYELHAFLKFNVILIIDKTEDFYYPPESKSSINDLLLNTLHSADKREKMLKIGNDRFAITQIDKSNNNWGYLCLQIDNEYVEDFIFSIMENASLAIAQVILRNKIIEEKKLHTESEVVRELITGNTELIKTKLPSDYMNTSYRVIMIDFKEIPVLTENNKDHQLQVTMLIRDLFERNQFHVLISTSPTKIIFIVYHKFHQEFSTKIIDKVIDHIIHFIENDLNIKKQFYFAVSRTYDNHKFLPSAYRDVIDLLKLKQNNLITNRYYDFIGLFSLFLKSSPEEIKRFVTENIGDLLAAENKTNIKLLNTLEVFLACNCSYRETANQLFIVRQTLYYRMNKIKAILGEDFLSPQKRIAIETAIKAHHYLEQK